MALCFHSVMSAAGDEDAASRLFELANAPAVAFRTAGGAEVSIRQDPANSTTGGCVWETAYLLAQWVEREIESGRGRWGRRWKAHLCGTGPAVRCLEVGAGCGLLGVALAHAGGDVTLTETADAMRNLEWNVEHNPLPPTCRGSVAARRLHWGDPADIQAAVSNGPFDLLLGTDVIYCASLVEPLLQTLQQCMHTHSTCWLCCQVRCPDSHEAMMRLAPKYFRTVNTRDLSGFMYAEELECFLLELRLPLNAVEKGVDAVREKKRSSPREKAEQRGRARKRTRREDGKEAAWGAIKT
ncbi:hypothetical protein AB1Y20_018938 [Prymnesium parvum]|uniref:Calmodulin-lysine N-methyltransferase n=1 Tax=Prymnesium parvum TaxID=97485 RepID=A0AB34JPJ2_PRYPA